MAGTTKKNPLEIINSDCRLWAKNMTKILDANNELIPFIYNNEQLKMLEALMNNKHVATIKARQLGCTEFCLNYILYNMVLRDNISVLVCSYEEQALRKVSIKFKRQFNSIPQKYKPKVTRDNDDFFALENGSNVTFKVAGFKEIIRGDTTEIILLTEFGMLSPEVQENAVTALEPLLRKNNTSRLIIESTAKNGMGDYFSKLCMNALRGNSKYHLVFFPWFDNKELYRVEYDMAEEWYKKENKGIRLSEKDLDPYELNLFNKGATLKQLMWRKWKLLDMALNKFYNEHPSQVQEAFAGNSTDNVFDQDIILQRLNHIESNNIKPLEFKEVEEFKPLPDILKKYYGKGFYIFKTFKGNEKLWAGIDTALGIGGDRDSQTVNILNSDGEQIAVFNRNDVPIYKFADVVYEIGMYFNYMMLNIEVQSNGGTGADLIYRLKQKGYIQILKTKKFNKTTGKSKMEPGWVSLEGTKSKLISDLKEYFETCLICINDIETLNQLNIYVEKNGKMGNMRGNDLHDDLVISLGLAVYNMQKAKSYI